MEISNNLLLAVLAVSLVVLLMKGDMKQVMDKQMMMLLAGGLVLAFVLFGCSVSCAPRESFDGVYGDSINSPYTGDHFMHPEQNPENVKCGHAKRHVPLDHSLPESRYMGLAGHQCPSIAAIPHSC